MKCSFVIAVASNGLAFVYAAEVDTSNATDAPITDPFDKRSYWYNGCGCALGDGTFCGVDGNCHRYNCGEFFEYGSRNFTGNPGGLGLECQNIPITDPGGYMSHVERVFYESVEYGCRSINPKSVAMGFTKKCTADTPTGMFTCYGLAEETDYQPFLTQANISALECADDEYDETGWPKFSYSAVTEHQGKNPGVIVNHQGFNGTAEFNETKALTGSMYSKYEWGTNSPTQSPTASPTIAIAPSSGPIISMLFSLATVSFALLFTLCRVAYPL